MNAPARSWGHLSAADLANFSVSRSGASVTVRCWYPTCGKPIVFRGRSLGLNYVLEDVERHWQVHHQQTVPGYEQPTLADVMPGRLAELEKY